MKYKISVRKPKRLSRVSSGLINLKPLITTHKLKGIDKLPEIFQIAKNKAKYKSILSAQVIID